jgi:undecaprenyl-diphosphatase
LKHVFQRDRPFLDLHEVALKIPAPITSSFPSGHTSASWCFALLFTVFFWKRSRSAVILVWTLAIGIAFSRFYLQVHYPSDIL